MARKNRKSGKRQARKPVLRLGGGRFEVVFGPGLGDPRVWEGAEGARVKIALAEVVDLERMWERSDG